VCIMEVATPTEDCLVLIHDFLCPIIKARDENSLNRQEVIEDVLNFSLLICYIPHIFHVVHLRLLFAKLQMTFQKCALSIHSYQVDFAQK